MRLNLPGFLVNRRSRFIAAVVAPTLVVCAYLGIFASDGYVSRTQILIEQDSSPAVAGAELALGLISSGGGRSKKDALLIEQYLLSRTVLEKLQEALDLKSHFSDANVDWISRLDPESSFEDFLDYYHKKLDIRIDEDSLVVSVAFVAYSPDFAKKVIEFLIAEGERFINGVSTQLAQQQLDFVQKQVDVSHMRFQEASVELLAVQKRNQVLSPEQEAMALGEILSSLEVERSKQLTQLKSLSAYLNDNAPDVVAIRQRVSALDDQISQERDRLVGTNTSGLNDLALIYKEAEVGVALSAEMYRAALASLESTRLDVAKKVKFLVAVDQPSLPEDSEVPRVGYWTITTFFVLNIFYFVVTLIVATIRDHRE